MSFPIALPPSTPTTCCSYWAKDLLCVLQAEIKGTGPGPVFLRCTWGHMRAVNKDNVASRCGEKNKKPRQIKLGNMDLIFSFPLLLLEIGQRHKKWNGPKIWEMMDHQAQIPALSLSAYSRTFHKHLYKKPGKSFTWCLPTCLGSPNPEVINEAPWALTLYESG